MSLLSIFGAGDGAGGITEDAVCGTVCDIGEGRLVNAVLLAADDAPFWTATLPKDFTPSDLINGAEAGDDDMGAAASSIEPKVTEEPEKGEKMRRLGILWEHTRFDGAYTVARHADSILNRHTLAESAWTSRVGCMCVRRDRWGDGCRGSGRLRTR